METTLIVREYWARTDTAEYEAAYQIWLTARAKAERQGTLTVALQMGSAYAP
jgi:hypothetical protein